jgi:asparagine N-glycosylation enzyme membrane subunit Stt3
MDRKTSAPLKKSTIVLCLTLIAVYAFFIRCLHLLDPDHYYIISADSYFFHWMAELVQSGQTVDHAFQGHTVPTIWHTGITYPLAYIAKAISFVFGMSPADALTFTSKFLPPTLSVISIVIIYLTVSRMFNQRVALFSAFTWAILQHAFFVQGAGYLDRDGLSVLLIMIGAFIFYLSRGWHWKIGHLDLGWFVGALAVVVIEAMLLLEWVWIGPVLLLTILTIFFVVEVLARFFQRMGPSLMKALTEASDILILARQSLTAMAAAIRESNWKPFALIIALSALAGGISPGFTYMFRLGTGLIRAGFSPGVFPVAEMQGIGLGDFITYGLLIIPIVIGLCVALIKHHRSDIFCVSWFASLLFLGFFARRMLLYNTPAVAIISGLGLSSIFDLGKTDLLSRYMKRDVLRYAKIGATAFLLFLLFLSLSLSTFWAYKMSSARVMAADNNWQDALAYLRDNTPKEAVIMSWWDFGYWILDLAERRPVIDGGFYAYDWESLHDVGLAYATSDASEAVQVMQKYGADYLVFSEIERVILPDIAEFGLGKAYGDDPSIDEELKDCLYNRSLSGDFQSGQGLKVVYRNEEVVILGLE